MHADGTLVGINTNAANRLAREALENGLVASAPRAAEIVPEQRYGTGSRIDFLIKQDGKPDHYVEVKNVHLRRRPNLHEFPDSVTARGRKHLEELIREVQKGNRATMLFMVQRDDGDRFAIAEDIDPAYASTFRQALDAGVEAICIKCRVSETEIIPYKKVDIIA